MRSLIVFTLVSIATSTMVYPVAKPEAFVDVQTEIIKNLPKGIGAAVGKEAGTFTDLVKACSVMAAYCALQSRGDSQEFYQLFVKQFLGYAAATRVSILFYGILIKEPRKTVLQLRKLADKALAYAIKKQSKAAHKKSVLNKNFALARQSA